jgi:hypothetical protein
MRFIFNERYSSPAQIIINYSVIRKAWLRSFTLADCRGILNQLDNKLTANLRIKNTDIPLTRDDSWTFIQDPKVFEKATESLHIVVEQHEIALDGLQFSEFKGF